ncbi:MAG: GFA family protein [Gammaproteobacteria bacterium]
MLKGSCLCQGVAYTAAGPVHHASHCYCTMCQKQHGAAAGTYANVDRAGLVIERGQDLIAEYASSELGRRNFCRVCGSTLFWHAVSTPDRIAIAMGTLDEGSDGPVDRELCTDTKPAWLPVR